MKVQVVVLPDGKFSAFIDKQEGDFEAAKAALQKLLAGLNGEGVEFSDIGQIEKHTHEAVGVQNVVTAGG
jgi:hypothetical protein